MAEDSLFYFALQAWHVLEPGPFVDGRHIRVICRYLEAVTLRLIRKLLINMPPRHMKSLLVSVFWPVWEWIRNPGRRWLFSSYDLKLSLDHAAKARALIESPWFQERWGDRFRLLPDTSAKGYYANDQLGFRISTATNAGATGRGGDTIVVDDPHNVRKAESEADRAQVLHWWQNVMPTRGNDPKTVARVIVMQRVHEEDLSGHVLEAEEGWEHLSLPARYDPKDEEEWGSTCLGRYEWREDTGELLWPERFGEKELGELEASMDPAAVPGQLGQHPVSRQGGIFNRDWFPVVDAVPRGKGIQKVRSWDLAATDGAGDWTVGLLLSLTSAGIWYVEDVVREQLGPAHVEGLIRQTAALDGPGVPIRIEQEPGSSGKTVAYTFVTALRGYDVRARLSTGKKVVRLGPVAAQAKVGNFRLVKGEWNTPFLREIGMLPRAKNDDQGDALSGAFEEIVTHGGGYSDGGGSISMADLKKLPSRGGGGLTGGLVGGSRRRYGDDDEDD